MVFRTVIFMKQVSFGHQKQDFFKSLKEEVNTYFKQTNQSKTGNAILYSKTIVFLSGYILVYLLLMLLDLPAWLGLSLAAVMGFFGASIGFNIMHDACHGSYSTKKWVNEVMGLTMNFIGSNAFIWKQKHNVIHHTYTNIDGVDDDIAKSPLLRHCKSQKWKPAHRFQHVYMFFLYGVSSMFWAWVTDVNKYFKQRIYTTRMWKMPLHEHIIFWVSKLFYVLMYVAIPIYVKGFSAWWPAYLVMNAVFGIWLSVVFQLAHVVEETEFEELKPNEKLEINDWAIHQIKTTSDFAPDNRIISYLVGGLNFQVEHHLFPQISHVHYPAIQKLVRQQCEKFGITYHYHPKMIGALASHYRTMRSLGQAE